MDDKEESNNLLAVKTSVGSVTWSGKKVAELITILLLLVVGVMTYALWEHKKESKVFSEQYIAAMKAISTSIERSAVSQREFSCLISREQSDRRDAFVSGECRAQAEFGSTARRD